METANQAGAAVGNAAKDVDNAVKKTPPRTIRKVSAAIRSVLGLIVMLYAPYMLIYKQFGTPCGVFGPLTRVSIMLVLVIAPASVLINGVIREAVDGPWETVGVETANILYIVALILLIRSYRPVPITA